MCVRITNDEIIFCCLTVNNGPLFFLRLLIGLNDSSVDNMNDYKILLKNKISQPGQYRLSKLKITMGISEPKE